MLDRMVRAVRLDRTLFRQVADNPEYQNEAVIIAVIVSAIAAVGSLFAPENGVVLFIMQFLNGLLFGWLLWAAVAYFVGANLFKGRSSVGEMMRTLAYAGVPRLLGVFGFIPCVGWIVAVVGWVLSVIAGVIAIRESMEFDTTNAVITAVLGFLLFIIASIILGMLLAPITALGAGLAS
jgi:uncharacterized membrane protein